MLTGGGDREKQVKGESTSQEGRSCLNPCVSPSRDFGQAAHMPAVPPGPRSGAPALSALWVAAP